MITVGNNEFEQTLGRVAEILSRAKIPYALTGGYLSILYGDPRSTQDIDIVVCLSETALESLLPALSKSFLISEEAARHAVRSGKFFQALDFNSSIKVELHVVSEMSRELTCAIEQTTHSGSKIYVLTKEDAIVAKLRWVKRGSMRSRRDIKGMLLNSVPFDRKLVLERAGEYGCEDLFPQIEIEEPVPEVE